jgi:hypothetical protein
MAYSAVYGSGEVREVGRKVKLSEWWVLKCCRGCNRPNIAATGGKEVTRGISSWVVGKGCPD